MINGLVHGQLAVVRLTVRSTNGQELELDSVLDTGFAGFLTLSPAVVRALALPFSHFLGARLADDKVIRVAVHLAQVLWDGVERDIEVLATGRESLLGTAMLNGHEVVIQFTDGGLVTLETL